LNNNWPANEKKSMTPAATQHASRAVRMRCSAVSFGVIARNAGTTATGSTITKSELAASKMYSSKLMRTKLDVRCGKSQ
jgi:hypothetical protein